MKSAPTLRIFETSLDVADKYTVLIYDHLSNMFDVFTMSENALSPNGVNMFCMECREFAPRVDQELRNLRGLPKEVLIAIIYRLTPYLRKRTTEI